MRTAKPFRRYVHLRIDSRNEWINLAITAARMGDDAEAKRLAMRACRSHARALRNMVRS